MKYLDDLLFWLFLATLLVSGFLIGKYIFPKPTVEIVPQKIYISREQEECEAADGKMEYTFAYDANGYDFNTITSWSCVTRKRLIKNSFDQSER